MCRAHFLLLVNHCSRPYYYQSGQSEDDISPEAYDYKEYPDNSKAYFSDYYTEESPPGPLPLNDYQQALMRQNFIDFLIRQGPNMYKDHKKMKYMYRATNTYPKPLSENADYNNYNRFYQGEWKFGHCLHCLLFS